MKIAARLSALIPAPEVRLVLFHALRRKNPMLRFADVPPDPDLDEQEADEALRIATARKSGRLLQHLLQNQFFYEHEYQIDASVLVPRPETEILIQKFIELVEPRFGTAGVFRFAELGLGSGILSCEILARFSGARGVASELSPASIRIAKANLDRITPDWGERFEIQPIENGAIGFECFQGSFDFVISNPPYVSRTDEIEDEVLRHEPSHALFPKIEGDEQPSYFYENFLVHADRLLDPEGMAFFEVPHERARALLQQFKERGFPGSILEVDLTGRPRVLIARR